jgi:calcineurin-like phosphoesterase family protein
VSDAVVDGGRPRRRRPWWLLAVGYAVAVVSYVAITLPGTTATPTSGDATPERRASKEKVELAAVGDIGMDATAERLLRGVGKAKPDVFLPLGDLSYAGPDSEEAWCRMVTRLVGPKVPVQLVAGNHEDDTGADGSVADFARCLPDRRQAAGSYPAQYYFDDGRLLRTVVISPDLDIAGHHHFYGGGSVDERWLRGVLDDARRRKISWIVVAMHKPCLSIGEYGCDIHSELLNLLVDYRVDLVLHGHDHTYQRTVQLGLSPGCPAVPVDRGFDEDCVVDDGADRSYRSGEGPVFVVVGSGTGRLYPLLDSDADARYIAAAMGANRKPTSGFLKLTVDAESVSGRFVKTSGPSSFGDQFKIGR